MSLRIVIANLLAPELAERIKAADDRFDVVYRPDLFAPLRFPSDWTGEKGWQRTDEQQAELDDLLLGADVLFSIPDNSAKKLRWVAEHNDHLKLVQTIAAGGGAQVRSANLAPDDLARIEFTTSAGTHTTPLSEFAILGALFGLKDLPRLQADQARHVWSGKFPLRELCDQTVVIVGMGSIGIDVADKFNAFGSTVIGVNRSKKDVPNVEMHTTDALLAQAARADILVNALPAAVGTDKLISREVLEALPKGAIIISVGRGNCIDEEAMIELLQSGHLGFAALDVFAKEPLPAESPLWDLPNVFISPHTMALVPKEADRVVDVFIGNAKALLDGQPLRNQVDKVLFY